MENINSQPVDSRSMKNSGDDDLGVLQKKVLREG